MHGSVWNSRKHQAVADDKYEELEDRVNVVWRGVSSGKDKKRHFSRRFTLPIVIRNVPHTFDNGAKKGKCRLSIHWQREDQSSFIYGRSEVVC